VRSRAPEIVPRPTQRELRAAFDAGASRARADAEAHEGEPIPDEAAIRAKAAEVYPGGAAATFAHDELARTWVDGYLFKLGAVSR
jgi:hypothetical protein